MINFNRRLVETINVGTFSKTLGGKLFLAFTIRRFPTAQLAKDETAKIKEISAYCNRQFDSISKLYKVNQMKILANLDFTYSKRK